MEISRSQQATTLERLVTDLVKLKSELRAKDAQIADQHQVIQRQDTELTQLRTDAEITLEQFQRLRLEEITKPKTPQPQQTIGKLATEIREKDLNMREKDQILRERESEIRSMIGQIELQLAVKDQDQTKKTSDDTQLASEVAKVNTLQEEIRRLKTALAALELQLQSEKAMVQQYRDDVSQSQAVQDAAQLAVNTERARSEKYVQDIEQQTAAYGQLKSQMEAQEARSQKLTEELNTIQASSQRGSAELRDQMQVLEQREQEHAKDVAEARQTMNFFKRNSEASTRKVKGLEAEVKSLMQSLQTSDGAQIGNSMATSPNAAPGAWPGTDSQGIRSSASLRRKPLGNPSII